MELTIIVRIYAFRNLTATFQLRRIDFEILALLLVRRNAHATFVDLLSKSIQGISHTRNLKLLFRRTQI